MGASRATAGFLTLLAFLLRANGVQGWGYVGVVADAGAASLAVAVLAPVMRGVVREPFLLLGSLVAVVATALWASGSFDLVRATVVAGVVGAATGAGRPAFDGQLQRDALSA